MDTKLAKTLPQNLTSYDLLKALALVLMIIDHIGFYFFTDEIWRAIGRLSAPIWLFLIGYAKSRDLSPPIWIGAGLLLFSNFVVGQALLPLNMLVTMILMRLTIDPVMERLKHHPQALYPLIFVLFLLTFFTAMIFEYGAISLAIVMAGYLYRNPEFLPRAHGINHHTPLAVAIIAGLCHNFFQSYLFFPNFSLLEKGFVLVGLLAVMVALTRFKSVEYPNLSARLPKIVSGVLQLAGRRSLEIYVIHLILFKVLALLWGYPGFGLFEFKWF
jgi:uncharacterized membrane protein